MLNTKNIRQIIQHVSVSIGINYHNHKFIDLSFSFL